MQSQSSYGQWCVDCLCVTANAYYNWHCVGMQKVLYYAWCCSRWCWHSISLYVRSAQFFVGVLCLRASERSHCLKCWGPQFTQGIEWREASTNATENCTGQAIGLAIIGLANVSLLLELPDIACWVPSTLLCNAAKGPNDLPSKHAHSLLCGIAIFLDCLWAGNTHCFFFRYKYKLMNSWNFISSYISVLYVTASLKGALNSKRGQHIASSFIASEMHALSGTFA